MDGCNARTFSYVAFGGGESGGVWMAESNEKEDAAGEEEKEAAADAEGKAE